MYNSRKLTIIHVQQSSEFQTLSALACGSYSLHESKHEIFPTCPGVTHQPQLVDVEDCRIDPSQNNNTQNKIKTNNRVRSVLKVQCDNNYLHNSIYIPTLTPP